MKKINIFAQAVLFAVIIGLVTASAVLLYQMQSKVSEEKRLAEEAAKPAELEITILSAGGCSECLGISNYVAAIKKDNKINITKEQTFEYASDEGAVLVQKYGIARVPTILISGQVEKAFDTALFIKNLGKQAEDKTLVVTNVPPPYVDVASGAVKGRFTATYLDNKNCEECYSLVLHRQALAGLGMMPTEEKMVDLDDLQGEQLVLKYNIESVPTLLMFGDLEEYSYLQQVWPSVGTIEQDGTYVFRQGQALMGTYYDLKTNKLIQRDK